MKSPYPFFLLFLFLSGSVFSQRVWIDQFHDTIYYNGLSFGTFHDGIGLGSFKKYNGIHLTVVDKDSIDNGISISAMQASQWKKTNGLELSLFTGTSRNVNGLAFSTISTSSDGTVNGMAYASFFVMTNNLHGLSIAGGFNLSENMGGVALAGIDNTCFVEKGLSITGLVHIVDSLSGGVALCGLYQRIERMHGVAFSPFNFANEVSGVQLGLINKSGQMGGVQLGLFNKSNQLAGVQFGLFNTISSKKHFKRMPLMNIGFRRREED